MYRDIDLYKTLHIQNSSYGSTANQYTKYIADFIKYTEVKSVLDFGCGKGSLKKDLKQKYNLEIDEYDPAIESKNIIPKTQYELIITTDVLEHLYEDEINMFFKDILTLNPYYMFHAICTRKADNNLPDGTNAHKTIKPRARWIQKISSIIDHEISFIEPQIKQTDTFVLYCYKKNV